MEMVLLCFRSPVLSKLVAYQPILNRVGGVEGAFFFSFFLSAGARVGQLGGWNI